MNQNKHPIGLVWIVLLLTIPLFGSDRAQGSEAAEPAQSRSPAIPAALSNWLDTTPVRNEKPLVLRRRAGYAYTCQECHTDFKNPLTRSDLPIGEHRGMVFDHGLNLNCLSCHHPENRDVYRDHDFSEIPADQPVMLCRKCHGPIYQDWAAGIHGRLNGYWDVAAGPQTKLACNRCHDPHQPTFQPLAPMPPPGVSRLSRKAKGAPHE